MTSKEEYKDYNVKFKDFLKEIPVEPTKAEFAKIKEQDQIKHAQRFDRNIAILPENTKLNRYTNILPYDYNRIVLKELVNDGDYINGSYIHQPSDVDDFTAEEVNLLDLTLFDNIKFIATQGPTPTTLEHHWQAIFDNNVDIILMLTKFVEGSKETNNEKIKCERYFPMKSDQCQPQSFNNYGKFEVLVSEEEEIRPNLTKSSLYVMNTESNDINNDSRQLILLHYTGWPDFGAPEDTSDIIELVKDVRKIIKDEGKNRTEIYSILVHCSAGVGRTGTFIGLYKLMEEIEQKLERSLDQNLSKKEKKKSGDPLTKVNIFETVMLLREKRCEMVQSYAQYRYLYACVADFLKDQNKIVALAEDYNSLLHGFDD